MNGKETLNIIFREIEESNAIAKLDFRFNQIIDNMDIHENLGITHRRFNEILIDFIEQLYFYKIDKEEIYREAFTLVNKFYYQKGSGYSIAIIDVIYYGEDIKRLLKNIAESIISNQLSKHTEWAIQKNIDPNNWELKKEILNEILTKYKNILPKEIILRPRNQLVLHLELLIKKIILSDQPIHKALSQK